MDLSFETNNLFFELVLALTLICLFMYYLLKNLLNSDRVDLLTLKLINVLEVDLKSLILINNIAAILY